MNQETPQSPASNTPAAPKKSRSPVERIVVYSMIVVLLVLVGIQAHARFGYTMTLNNLRPRIDDEDPNVEALPITEIPEYIVGWPSRSEGEVSNTVKSIEYRWTGLLGKSYGLTLTYNTLSEPYTVQGLASDDAAEPEDPFADEAAPAAEEGGDAGAEQGPGGGGGPGAGAGPSASHGGPGGDGERPRRRRRPEAEGDAEGPSDGDATSEPAPEAASESDQESDSAN